jgi:hypothetical protein
MLGLIDAAFEAACCFEAALELVAMVFDVVAWRRSRSNRVARREARRAGEPVPPMSGWAKTFVILLAVVIVLVAVRVAVIVSRR